LKSDNSMLDNNFWFTRYHTNWCYVSVFSNWISHSKIQQLQLLYTNTLEQGKDRTLRIWIMSSHL